MASRLMRGIVSKPLYLQRSFASVKGPSAEAGDHGGGAKMWKLISFAVAIPGVIVCFINAQLKEKEHKAHWKQPEFIPYEHLRIRSKPWPWGDGNHSFFHDPEKNPLPDGYEVIVKSCKTLKKEADDCKKSNKTQRQKQECTKKPKAKVDAEAEPEAESAE